MSKKREFVVSFPVQGTADARLTASSPEAAVKRVIDQLLKHLGSFEWPEEHEVSVLEVVHPRREGYTPRPLSKARGRKSQRRVRTR